VPQKNIFFDRNQPFHILSRAVEGREIFKEKEDCLRFIFQMYAANTGKPAFNLRRKDIVEIARNILAGEKIASDAVINEHPPLVSILSFSLVFNHYHFSLVANVKGGITSFMQRLNIGFAKYINLKYKRRGALFESRYKAVPVQSDFQMDAVLRYINIINPLDVYQPGWRDVGLTDQERAFKFLDEYQFSSFPDIFGRRNSKITAPQEMLEKFLGIGIKADSKEYIKFIKDFLENKKSHFPSIFLE